MQNWTPTPLAALLIERATSVGWRKAASWFPGHMFKATQAMSERLRNMDLVIEVRDARVRVLPLRVWRQVRLG